MATSRAVDPSTLTPGAVRAWAAILLLPDHDVRTRPVAAIASALNVDKSIVSRYLDRLIRAGVVQKIDGRIGAVFCPIADEISTIVSSANQPDLRSIQRGEFGGGVDQIVDRNWWAITVNGVAATLENSAIFSSVSKSQDLRIYTDPENDGRLTLKKMGGAAAVVQRVATLVVGRERPGPKAARDAFDAFFLEAYTSRRRRVDPMFEARRGDSINLRRAREALEFRQVQSPTWGRYLDWLFDWFPRFTDCPFPPTSIVASENMIDRFVATLGERRLDVNKAARMLAAAGFDDVRVSTVCSIARSIAASGRRGKIDPPRVGEAVDWLVPRLREVGYRNDEE